MVDPSSSSVAPQEVLDCIPHRWPMRFIKSIQLVTHKHVQSTVFFDPSLPFYKGHFPQYPITPGVLLTEALAQAGILPMAILLFWRESGEKKVPKFVLSSDQMDYFLPVLPGATLQVEAWQLYFRFGKLKGKVELKNSEGNLVARGEIAGMLGIQDSIE